MARFEAKEAEDETRGFRHHYGLQLDIPPIIGFPIVLEKFFTLGSLVCLSLDATTQHTLLCCPISM